MNELDPLPLPLPPPDAETKPSYPFWDYHDLILFIAAALPSMILSALLVRGLRFVFGQAAGSKAFELLLVQFLAYSFWFLCLYAILHFRYAEPFWSSLAWQGTRRGIAFGMFTGPFLALAVAIIGAVLDSPEVDMPIRDLLKDRFSIILVGLFATTLGPLCEELAFRGFLQPLFSRTFGPFLGIVLANLPFALLHGPQYGWSWQHILLVGGAGATFGIVRHKTGSTAAAAGMHATYDLTFFTGFVFQQRG